MKRPIEINRRDCDSPPDQGDSHRRIRLLAGRLDDGYRRIDEAIAAGDDVVAWEDFWIRLLQQYEELCDDMAAA